MSDIAAHLVDEVLPEVPIRQWVCSLPWRLRTALAYDRHLCADVLDAFVGALTRSLRRRAKKVLGLRSIEDALTGAVTFIQRSDSALRLNVHAHTLALDGVYVRDAAGVLVFHALEAPTAEDIRDVARRTHAALIAVLARHGRSFDGTDEDVFATEEPVLASCAGASAADLVLIGERAGQRTSKLGRTLRLVSSDSGGSYAEFDGVNIHAGVAIDGRDRKRLERVCRYIARPPLALERLEEHGDGRVRYRFKKPWKDGTEAVLLEPMDFIARLAALIPPPRFHMLRYHGILAANAKVRAEVVPQKPIKKNVQLPLFAPGDAGYLEPPPRAFETPVALASQAGLRGGYQRVSEVHGTHAGDRSRQRRTRRGTCSFRARHRQSASANPAPHRPATTLVVLRRLSDFLAPSRGTPPSRFRGLATNAHVPVPDRSLRPSHEAKNSRPPLDCTCCP